MPAPNIRPLKFSTLKRGLPGVTRPVANSYVQAAEVCLLHHGHHRRIQLTVDGDFIETFGLKWRVPTNQTRRSWADLQEATERGASAIAFLLMLELTDYTVIERSRKGTGFDYWLGKHEQPLFQRSARLEISGMLSGSASLIDSRVRQKKSQTQRSDGALPAFVVVVEFGTPTSKVVKR